MRKIKLLAVLLAIVFLLCGCGTKLNESLKTADAVLGFENDITMADYMLIAENEALSFWFNKDTTAFKIIDKSNGYEWVSTGSNMVNNSELAAPFKISYVNESGLIETMDAMTASINEGQYKYERTDDGIKVIYSLGEYKTDLNIPLAITEERLKSISDNIEDDFLKSQFENMYQYTDIDNLDETNREKFLEQYPKLSDKPLYILRDRILESDDKMKELAYLLAKNGYTDEMYEEDKEYFISEETGEVKITPQFRIALEYSLNDDGFTVTVPQKEIQMSADFPIVELELLKYFGAPAREDSGYFLLPDGSGSLMNFYNGRGDLQNYSVDIYGIDYSATDEENIYGNSQAYLPVYGIKNGSNAMFSVIEKGDAITTLNAFPGNEQLSAYVAPTLKLRSHYKSYMSGSNTASNYFVSIQNKRYSNDIVVRYAFLNGENADFSGMAQYYRDYLFGEKKVTSDNSAGVIVECVGQIDKSVKAFGFSYKREIPLTTFDQVKKITDELKSLKVKNISVKMSSWFGGAYNNRYAGKLDINSKLGKESDLKELAKYLEKSGIGFYPDVDFQYTYTTGLFDGFSTGNDVATLVSKSKGYKIEFNPATFYRDPDFKTPAYINTPNAIKKAFSSFFKDYKDLGIGGVSLRNVGRNLDGDYNDDNGTDRQQAADMLFDSLKTVDKDYSIMTNGANAYTLNYVDYCCDVPLKSGGRDNTDESVPFLQMVLSGNVGYSGSALNLSGDPQSLILDMAAVAADAYYVVSAQNSEEIRKSDYSFLYSSNFDYLKDDMSELLNQYSKDMKELSGKPITDYQKLAQNLYKTVFADGSTVTVNYDVDDIKLDGITYEAKSYVIEKGAVN